MGDVLVLNFTYEPLNVVDFGRAVRLLLAGKAEIARDPATNRPHVHGSTWRSELTAIALPTVVRMLYYVKRSARQRVPLTKKNVLLRDDYRCAYCGLHGGHSMTVDHVTPKRQGGRSTWTNLVASCARCNSRKRDRTPAEAGMPLRTTPREPRSIPWVSVKRHTQPAEWALYLTTYNVSV